MEALKKEFNQVLKYLISKPRTVHEVIQYLISKDINKENITEIINRLKHLNYLNDRNYCVVFINSNRDNNKSKRQILKALENKGINREISINLINDLYSDEMELKIAEELINKLCNQIEPISFSQLKNKIIYKLKYKEFSSDTIRQAIEISRDNELFKQKLIDSEEKILEKAKVDGLKYFNKYSKKYDNKFMVKRYTLNALQRKGYDNDLCYRVINELF
ncbi:RecX family transcriptional regulator [Serpentinicella alkaliphila]|uniref:Regulatory protein RecX n=1 Tax=Serpentinicella alkaliphila TaxID=1734049 RepID=A0A4V2T3W3_9FIRM|nr:RecX family transcriptional regulator [Serpentinicella alkaliphila]QUH26600.1 RecX family transcriptional regulator [Serpentinicella alkaliphila]TCQ02934.1 SOS response regulatory protein OraA/RecX [Serpentinicella alkaliphila]